MDMSKIVWPVIILAVVGLGWLGTSGGTSYMYKQYTKSTVGEDVNKDVKNEASLSKLAGFLMKTFQYKRAAEYYQTAIDRYTTESSVGKNYWMNIYNQTRCYEKLDDNDKAADNLVYLRDNNADGIDERVPDYDTLNLRLQKLVEVFQLDPVKYKADPGKRQKQ